MAIADNTSFTMDATKPLANWGLHSFDRYATNAQKLHEKNQRNLDNFRGDTSRLPLWRRSDLKNEDSKKRITHTPTHINQTQQKVMTMYSMLVDTMFSGGNIPFYLKMNDEAAMMMPPPMIDLMNQRMAGQEALMRYQHEKTKSDMHLMAAVFSGCLYGRGWLKRVVKPVTMPRFEPVGLPGDMRWIKSDEQVLMPGWEVRSVWNMFRDMEARELSDAQRIFERYYWCAYDLKQLSGPNVDWDAVDRVLKLRKGYDSGVPTQGPSTAQDDPFTRDLPMRDRGIRMVEMWGRAPIRQIEAHLVGRNEIDMGDMEDEGDDAHVRILFADDEVVQVEPIEPSESPYMSFELERNLDWQDTGIADKCEHMQRVINGIMNNTEKAVKYHCSIVLALKESMIEGEIEEWEHGLKIHLNDGARSVSDAIEQIKLDDVTQGAQALMELTRQFMDEDSMVPRQAQGQPSGDRVTAFEVSTKVEATDRYRGTIVRNVDEQLVEPAASWQLDYNMGDPEKSHLSGPFACHANGMTRYRNRTEMSARFREFMAMVASNPMLMASPQKGIQWDLFAMVADYGRMADLSVEQYQIPMMPQPMGGDPNDPNAQGGGDPNELNRGVPGAPPAPPPAQEPPLPGEGGMF